MSASHRPLRQARDARGVVFEPLEAAELAAQRNVHVVLTEPGAIRGNHYHRLRREIATVIGPARVAWRCALPQQDAPPGDPGMAAGEGSGVAPGTAVGPGKVDVTLCDVPEGEAWRFEFPPLVSHAFENTGRRTLVLLAFATEVHDPASPDTFRDLLLPLEK